MNDAEEKAARTAMRKERAEDAARAMREYEAERLAVVARTARLRALRLAKETGGAPTPRKRKRNSKQDR